MPAIDKDLRDGHSSPGALDHLASCVAATIHRIFGEVGANFRKQPLGANAIGAPVLGINFDLPNTLSRLKLKHAAALHAQADQVTRSAPP